MEIETKKFFSDSGGSVMCANKWGTGQGRQRDNEALSTEHMRWEPAFQSNTAQLSKELTLHPEAALPLGVDHELSAARGTHRPEGKTKKTESAPSRQKTVN